MNAQRSLFQDQTPTFDEVMQLWAGDRNWRSRAEIALALGRAKSPALITTVEMLTTVGYLTKRVIDLPNRAQYFQYAVAQKWIDQSAPF